MNALSLFSGIGGLDLAAEAAGIRTVALCERDPWCRTLLEARFPGVPVFDDVFNLRGDDIAAPIEVIHGGFPCQDLSVAGARAGLEGERSGLWFEMLRVIRAVRPAGVVVENVRGAIDLALDEVVRGLEEANYQVRPICLSASAFGAPHERYRLGVIALADTVCERLQGSKLEELKWKQGAQSIDEQSLRRCDGSGNLWPTPTVCGNHNRNGLSDKSGDGLSTSVKKWATPAAAADCQGSHGGGQGRSIRTDMHDLYGTGQGALNPDWVEILMGYPIGWTDPECDAPRSWPGWPMGKGLEQYEYEPPRLTKKSKNRAARIKALGNAIVPFVYEPFFQVLSAIDNLSGKDV